MFREVIISIWCEQRRVNGECGIWAIKGRILTEMRLESILRCVLKGWKFQLQKVDQVWFLQKNEGQTEKTDWNQKEIIYFEMLESIIVGIVAI